MWTEYSLYYRALLQKRPTIFDTDLVASCEGLRNVGTILGSRRETSEPGYLAYVRENT